MALEYLIKFDPDTGERINTYPCDNTISAEQKNVFLEEGFELVSEDIFKLLIGNIDGKEYIKNIGGTGYKEKPAFMPPIEEIKRRKREELKDARDLAEIEPIEYNGNLYDYDEKARDRINAAIIALEQFGSNATLKWTMADNTSVEITASDLRNVITAVAVRSNALHIKYRQLKELIDIATTYEELNEITWDMEIRIPNQEE